MKNTVEQLNSIINEKQQIIKFLFVGGFLFIIDFSVTLVAYYIFNLGPGMSSGSGFIASFIIGFSLNKKLVFKHDNNSRFSTSVQAILYLLLSLFNLAASSVMIEIIVNNGAMIELVKPTLVAIIAVWNFLIFKYFVFSHKK